MIPNGKILLERSITTKENTTRIVALIPDDDQTVVRIYNNQNKIEEISVGEFALTILLNQ